MLILPILLSCVSVLAATQTPLDSSAVSDQAEDGFGAYVAQVGRAFKLPGLSVAVVRKGQSHEYYTWGKSTEAGDPVTPDTMFSIGSCSKAFTSISMGLLMDDYKQGRNVTPLPEGVELDWTTKVVDILPGEWKLLDDWATEKASLLDIFSHVTGLPRHDLSYNTDLSLKELVHNLRYLRPTYEFREQWQYNNLMYATAAYIIGKYAGEPYPKFVQKRIFDPLGMTQATYYPQKPFDNGTLAELWVQQAGLYQNETRLVPYFLDNWSDESVEGFLAGAGGVIANIRDLSIWVETLLNKGAHPHTGEQVVPSEVLDRVMAGRSAMPALAEYPEHTPWVYGAGWWRVADRGHEFVQHGGTVTGSSTWITLVPNDDLAIVALVNGNGQHKALQGLTSRVVEDTFGLEHVDWIQRFLNSSTAKKQPEATREVPSAPVYNVPLERFAGTYKADGYVGTFELCTWPAEAGTACVGVLDEFALTDPTFEEKKGHALYARWKRFWSLHLKLTRRTEGVFAAAAYTLFPQGYGEDTSPFFMMSSGDDTEAEFSIVGGEVQGMGAWGLSAGPRERVPGEPRQSSEVWFHKIL